MTVFLFSHSSSRSKLELVPDPSSSTMEEADVQDLLQGSLRKAYGLAVESIEIRRSEHKDHAVILFILAMVGWLILLILSVPLMNDRNAFLYAIGLGTLALVAIAFVGMLLLRRRLEQKVKKDMDWAERLLSAIYLQGVEDRADERSTVVLLLEACAEMPRWLKLKRKGVWNRKPLKALLVFALMSSGATGVMSFNSGVEEFVPGVGGVLILLGALIVIDEHVKQRAEGKDIERDWESRMSGLKNVLGLEDQR